MELRKGEGLLIQREASGEYWIVNKRLGSYTGPFKSAAEAWRIVDWLLLLTQEKAMREEIERPGGKAVRIINRLQGKAG